MDTRTSHRQRRVSRKQEKFMAEDLGGRVQPASGAMPGAKGDVRADHLRGEAKFTAKSYYSLKHADLEKVKKEALEGGLEDAVLQLSFTDRSNRLTPFAIWPLEPGPGNGGKHFDGGQTYAKSLRLVKSLVELDLLRNNMVFISFDSRMGTERKSDWYAIAHWSEYLKWRAEQ